MEVVKHGTTPIYANNADENRIKYQQASSQPLQTTAERWKVETGRLSPAGFPFHWSK